MNAILLVGGLGTRLRPLTLTQPKALLPVLNKPFISYQLDLLREAGVRDVMLASGASIRRWKREIERLSTKNLKIHFAFEKSPLGTGGAVRYAFENLKKQRRLKPGPVLVFNGDVFFDFDVRGFVSFHGQKKGSGALLLKAVKDPRQFGVISLSPTKKIKRFVEKPKDATFGRLINAGAYLLEQSWIEKIPLNKVVSIERESFPLSLERGDSLFGYSMNGYWNDIGTPVTYLNAHRDLMSQSNRWTEKKYFRKRGHFLFDRLQSRGKNIHLEGFVCCGPRVIIGDNVRLKDCVVMGATKIGNDVSIEGSILGRGCDVGSFSKIGEGTVLGDKTVLPSFTRC